MGDGAKFEAEIKTRQNGVFGRSVNERLQSINYIAHYKIVLPDPPIPGFTERLFGI